MTEPVEEARAEEESKTESETEMAIETSYTGVWDYTGYLDECTGWTGYQEFVGCDYDEDGKTDHVYRYNIDKKDSCVYWIEFGNGAVIEPGKVVADTGFPHIQTADLQGDGIKEIIFTLSYDTSTGPMCFGDMAVFKRAQEDEYSYEKLDMPKPFKESEHGYSQMLPIHYEQEADQSLRITCADIGADFVLPIDTERWNDLQYKHYAGLTEEHPVWQVTVVETDGEKDKLECEIGLFDKWSLDEMVVTIGYEEGLVVEKVALNEE